MMLRRRGRTLPRGGRPTACCLALAAAALAGAPLAAPAGAQTILNTERFHPGEVAGPHVTLDASISGALGNARVVNAAASGIVGFRSERHWPRLIGGGQVLADRERRVLDDRFVQIRYSYHFAPRWETFHFVQYQANRSLLLRSRRLLGAGIRLTPIRTEATTAHIGTGLMHEAEDRDPERLDPGEPVRLRTVRLANQLVLRHRLSGGATVMNILYYQPAVDELAYFRLLNELGLAVPVVEPVQLTVVVEWRHDSRPPAALRRDDVRFRTGVRIDLR